MKSYIVLLLISLLPVSAAQAQKLPDVKLEYSSYAVSSDGRVIGYFGQKHRVDVKSTGYVSKYVIWSLIATEDRDFYNHDGVSLKGIARGIFNTLTGSTQGGSTLTMQLARNLYLSNERTIQRKLTEIDIARRLEEMYSKDQLMLMYLNTVYFGNGAYGIWAAAQEYFGKHPKDLTLLESAAVVGLLQSPNGYDPRKYPEKMLSRRNEVLYNLVETEKISEKEFKRLKPEPLNLKMRGSTGRHFLEYVRRQAVELLKNRGIRLSDSQLKITTTLDFNIQQAAENAVKAQWEAMPQNLKPAQVGIAAVEPGTGMIKALVGGNPESDYMGLNRAVQIKRQAGSAFKIFLYGELLNEGFTLGVPLMDAPIVVDSGKAWEWRPSNADDSYTNRPIPMIDAVENSVNLSAAYAITSLTVPDSVVQFAHRLGITSEIPSLPSIALGTGDVSPVDMAAAASVIASEGLYIKPFSIIKIEDKSGNILYADKSKGDIVLDSASAYLLTAALQRVVDSGTASSVRRYYKGDAAGKTGTTQNSTDTWFVGYTPKLAAAVWMGFDDPRRKLSGGFQYGGQACAPIWGRMMSEAAKTEAGYSSARFVRPSSVDTMELCTSTGLMAGKGCTDKKIYLIDTEKAPSVCSLHNTDYEMLDRHRSAF